MRFCRFLLTVAMFWQLCLSSAQAQLGDGECTVYLEPTQFHDFLLNEVGIQDVVDFAIAAPYMSTPPVTDGLLGDGEYANKCYFTYAENENPGQSWPALDNLNDGDPDLTTTLHFAHDDNFLYVAFDVTDDFLDLDNPANSFQNDGVELFINPDLDVGDGWGLGKIQIYVDASAEGDIEFNNRGTAGGVVRTIPFDGEDPVPGEFYTAGLVRADESGYVVEMQIPLSTLDTAGGDEGDPIPAETGDFVLINTAIDDNDATDNLAAQTGHHLMWHFDGAGSPFGGGEAIWPVPLQLTPEGATGPDGDYNGNGVLDPGDIDEQAVAMLTPTDNLAKYDENGDGRINSQDRIVWVTDLAKTWFGDANFDGSFSTDDLVQVFAAGKYETADSATWEQGDWDGDMKFDSSDLVAAFSDGGFEVGPRPSVSAVPEPSSAVLLLLGCLAFVRRRK